MSQFQTFASQAVQPLKKAFHYLFAYDEDRLTIRGDSLTINLAKLHLAFLKRQYLLITLNDGSWQVGKITKRVSASRFVFRDADSKIFYLLDVNDILTVELP
ncbi:hypothetical protein lacNasYZ03_13440 [Lactobacillus nasalidis]|uniref:DUF2642 domain-containing protein n=1 Tax=Lactobacillus nasalidis TaxID=2797258 RepID=A0ABQ3WBR6_9LACO|nr:hypothetical protein [Lactobacillus nasalidis]GHV98406.1 hypothetical protein lacNasYZ01_15880 [Lactobacillus nasalidis]GHV98967.1 hypothetical protein lacNasYZ02_03970 [Lactobacillus nasalidis]GHW01657.1 hypothetical protein lacNasYZ03_13440 [Lactobacillus nasalidis]